MKIIGVTGGIGSGKTAVTDYLTGKGYTVIDADKAAREAVYPGSEGLKAIVTHFGESVLNKDGSLNRRLLGKIVFFDRCERETLNALLHERIRAIIDKYISIYANAGLEVLFLCAPLLIESDLYKTVDEVWLIDASDDIRMNRVMERDNISELEVKKRMDSQMSAEEKRNYAHAILDNSGGLDELYKKVDSELERL